MPKPKTVKPVTFRLYPEGSFLYCEVNIWPTKKAMYDYLPLNKKQEASCGGRELYIVSPKRRGRPQRVRKTGLFAEANFHQKRIGIEVVSHELTHAAFAFADRRNLDLGSTIGDHLWETSGTNRVMDQDGPEERFCYALGQMCRQFTQKCYDMGLYEEVVTSKT